ncbi:hypothetical protein EBR43_12525 [bacterium]|nr:hypothetical protein [bacterium]
MLIPIINNFTGNTEVQNGILTLNAGSSLGTGALTMNANGSLATLELNESASVASLTSGVSTTANNIISIASEKTLTINESFTRTFGTTVGSSTFTINGLGGLTMAGSGELTLDSTNSYTGLTSVTSGTLIANKAVHLKVIIECLEKDFCWRYLKTFGAMDFVDDILKVGEESGFRIDTEHHYAPTIFVTDRIDYYNIKQVLNALGFNQSLY